MRHPSKRKASFAKVAWRKPDYRRQAASYAAELAFAELGGDASAEDVAEARARCVAAQAAQDIAAVQRQVAVDFVAKWEASLANKRKRGGFF